MLIGIDLGGTKIEAIALTDLEAVVERPVRLANDADCFALSEAVDGGGQGAGIVFGVIIGTGTGAGIVANGRLLSGPNAIAGEWGHNPLPWPDDEELDGPSCYCGQRGCIETYVSGPGMSADHRRRGGPDLSPPEILQAAHQGDKDAELTLQRHEDRLARGLQRGTGCGLALEEVLSFKF